MIQSRAMLLGERLLRGWSRTQAAAAGTPAAGQQPLLLVCWPQANLNKYQALLYEKASEFGVHVAPISRLEELDEIFWPGPVVFHAHWFAGLHAGAADDAQARRQADEGFARIAAFRRRTGARLVWTAHNLLPHATPVPEAARAMRRRTLETFDLVHLLEADHLDLIAEAFGLAPARSCVVPHMTYDGVYPDYLGRAASRQMLDVHPDDFVVLAFGSIAAYKQLDRLALAVRGMRPEQGRDIRLVIAGIPTDSEAVDRLRRHALEDDRIILHARSVPDTEVQIYFNAADVAALPYADTLNSGAAALAATFRIPMVAPNAHAFRAYRGADITFYDPDAPSGLAAALERRRRMPQTARPTQPPCPERAAPLVSRRFLGELRRLVQDTDKVHGQIVAQ